MGPPPVVTGISPKEGPPGTRVTIRGEFLGVSTTDMIGLKICGCDCLLSAEWKSKNKIVARSGPCKGRGDIIVTTRSGGEGTSTVQFRGYHESIGPVKESAVWVEEAAPPSLPWGRRPMSPTTYTPPDPLGLSTEGDDCKFPEEELHEMFPDGSGKLSDDNFQPGWYLLEHHSNTSYEDLKAGMVFLQRKVESQREGQLSFLKANTGAVMDQLDRLVLLKNMYEEDERKNGKEPLPSLQAAIEESITLADSLFSEILSRKENADKTREALSLLTRHKFLFQLPASIDRNIRKKEYDLVVNDYTRVKNLFGNTDVKLFQKILAEIDKKIEDLKEKLYTRMKTMPINVQEQTKYIRLLISLNWEGDAAWVAITSRKEYLMNLMNKVRDHFKQKEEQESNEKGKRKIKESECTGGWSLVRGAWCAAAAGALAAQLHALWPLARRYFAGELAGEPASALRQAELKEMIIAAVELFSEHMRSCLLSPGGGKLVPTDALRVRLVANLRHLREAYDSLLKLDLPSQPLSIVEKVIFDYRVHGMTVFLQRAHKRVKGLAEKETWKIEEFSDYGAITNLPHLLETYLNEAFSAIHKCVVSSGRRESPLLAEGSEPAAILQKHTQQILLAYVTVLQDLALHHDDQEFNNSNLSVALEQRLEEGGAAGRSWQQRLLVAGANAHYTRRLTLPNIATAVDKYAQFNNSNLSVALEQRLEEGGAAGRSWQQRLLVAGANAHYTRRLTLPNIATAVDKYAQFNNSNLSVALEQRLEEGGAAGRSWQQRLLVAGANAHYTRRLTLPNIATAVDKYAQFNNSNLSVALEQRLEEGGAAGRSWQQRLLVAGANAHYTRRLTLPNIATAVDKYAQFNNSNLSVALEQRLEEGGAAGRSWQQRLLVAGANAHYTRRLTLPNIATAVDKYAQFNNSNLSVALEQRLEEGGAAGRSWQQRLLVAGANAHYTRRLTLPNIATAVDKYAQFNNSNLSVALEQRLEEGGAAGRSWQQRLLVAGANAHYTRRLTLPNIATAVDKYAQFNNSNLSVALEQRLEEGGAAGRSWQQRLLVAGANAHYTRRLTLPNIATAVDNFGFPKQTQALQATKEALSSLESTIAETYLEHKGDPLVGTIEPSMDMGRHKTDADAVVDDARPYVYEIINNLIAVHAEVDSVCGAASSRYVRDICETVCEELARLAATAPPPAAPQAVFQARLEYTLLHTACAEHLTRKAENYLMEALAGIPTIESEEEKKRMDKIVDGFKRRMELQLASLNCNMETV